MADANTAPAPIRISTEAVESRHRASLLGDVMARQLAGGHILTDGNDSPASEWILAPLGPGTVLGFGWQRSFSATRDAALLRDGDDDVSLFFVDRGAVPFEQNDRRTVLTPGQALIVAHSRAVRSIWDDAEFTVLRLPRAAFAGLSRIDAAGGMALDLASPAMHLLAAYLAALKPLAQDGAAPLVAARHLAELAGAAIGEVLGQGAETGDAVHAARLAMMRETMAAALGDPGLSMARVAARVGMSERAGYLLFEAAHLDFSETLFAMRLDRARDLLREGYSGRLLDLALDLGFHDQSHFNRRFRQRFGCTPGDMRRAPR